MTISKFTAFTSVAMAAAMTLALTPEEQAAREAQKKLEAEFKAFHKECNELAAKDTKGALASYWDTNTKEAIAKWEEALKDTKWTNSQRIDMLAAIADRQLNIWFDEKLALSTMNRMLQLPDLSEAELLNAKLKIANFKKVIEATDEGDYNFFLSVTENPLANAHQRNGSFRSAVEFLGQKDKAAAWALLTNPKYDAVYNVENLRNELASKFGPEGEAKRRQAAIIADYNTKSAEWNGKRFNGRAFTDIKIAEWAKRGVSAFKEEFPKTARDIVAKAASTGDKADINQARPSELLFNWAANVAWNDKNSIKRDGELRKFIYEMLSDPSCGTNTIPDARLMYFLNEQKETKELALPYAKKVVEESSKEGSKINKKDADAAFAVVAMTGTEGNPAKILNGLKKIVEFRGKKGDKQALASLIADYARQSIRKGDEKCARALLDEYRKLVPDRPQSHIFCEYWPDAPRDLGLILESARYKKAEKGLLHYPYGDNLKFLIETDAALTGREMTMDNGESFRPTEFFTFFDADGVKIILRSYEDMTKIKAGFGGAAGYEGYLAPGVEAPYWCYLFDPREEGRVNMSDGFITQYPNGTGYRPTSVKNYTLNTSSLYLDDGVAIMLSVPWSAAFMYTPDRESAWFFEPIHWSHGGRSWGGSTSVHYRSSFGKVEFKGADAKALTAIRRKLLVKAKKVFEAACNSRDNSPFDRWQDNVLGDQEFYKAKVEPFRKRLASYLNGERIKADMTDAEVNEIYEAVALDAFNCRYIISQMRTDWLEEKRARGE